MATTQQLFTSKTNQYSNCNPLSSHLFLGQISVLLPSAFCLLPSALLPLPIKLLNSRNGFSSRLVLFFQSYSGSASLEHIELTRPSTSASAPLLAFALYTSHLTSHLKLAHWQNTHGTSDGSAILRLLHPTARYAPNTCCAKSCFSVFKDLPTPLTLPFKTLATSRRPHRKPVLSTCLSTSCRNQPRCGRSWLSTQTPRSKFLAGS